MYTKESTLHTFGVACTTAAVARKYDLRFRNCIEGVTSLTWHHGSASHLTCALCKSSFLHARPPVCLWTNLTLFWFCGSCTTVVQEMSSTYPRGECCSHVPAWCRLWFVFVSLHGPVWHARCSALHVVVHPGGASHWARAYASICTYAQA